MPTTKLKLSENSRTSNQYSLDSVRFLRQEIAKEKTIYLDFGYLAGAIESWWGKCHDENDTHFLKSQLITIFLNYLHPDDSAYFNKVGFANNNIAAVCIKNIFSQDSPKLALTVHEALADLFYLTDIKYDYEEHKVLYLKPSAEKYREWGNGYGDITPHSDDLYENLNVDYLALTVCRDTTKTPTAYFFPKDLLSSLSDQEMLQLFSLKAEFISGKNVSGIKSRTRNVLEYSEEDGFQFFLDFRIDNESGERMRAVTEGQAVIDKIRAHIPNCPNSVSLAETGTFLIVANHKLLHARPALNMSECEAREQAEKLTFFDAPRLLFRSKGPRKNYFSLGENMMTRVLSV
jgi:hypothetical protein